MGATMEHTLQLPSMTSSRTTETLSRRRLNPVPIAFKSASLRVHSEKNVSIWLLTSVPRNN